MNLRTDSSTISIEADTTEVWRVLADDFLANAEWAPGVISSEPNPATPNGVNGSRYGGRISDIEGLGRADIRLVDYDASAMMLSYTLAADNIPPLIEKLQNTWTVAPDGDQRCTVASTLDVTLVNSMAETDGANNAVAAMFAQTAAALAALKTYIESQTAVTDRRGG